MRTFVFYLIGAFFLLAAGAAVVGNALRLFGYA